MPSTDPRVGRPGETRTYIVNFGNQPELATYGDTLTTPITAAIADAPNFTGTTPTLGTAFIPVNVVSVPVTAGGSGYTSPPTVAFAGGNPIGPKTQAQATAVVVNGVVTAIVMTALGMYKTAPTPSLSGGGGSGATLGSAVVANDTRVAVPITGGVDQNDYLLTVTTATAGGSTLQETVLFQVRQGPDP